MLQNREYYIKRVFICTGIVNFQEVHNLQISGKSEDSSLYFKLLVHTYMHMYHQDRSYNPCSLACDLGK